MKRCTSRAFAASGAFVAFVAFVAALACTLFSVPIASAHELGLSRGEYALEGSIVTAKLTFAWRDVTFAVPSLDADRDGTVTEAELAAARAALTAAFASRLVVRAPPGTGAACLPSLADAAIVEEDGLRVILNARCDPAAPRAVSVELGFFALLPLGHRHLAHVASVGVGPAAGADLLLSRTQRTLSLTSALASASASPSPSPSPSPSSPVPPTRLGLFGMGLEHILTGFDHLLFLLGLVLLGSRRGRAREPLLVFMALTAFTIGHSLSLAIATFGLWTPGARFVEPAIALSIVYVGVENVVAFSRDGAAHHRWRLTLPFGLVHGFGFASALRAIALPRAEVPAALLLFNLGVEAGQLVALGVALPILYAARRRGWLRERGLVVLSLAIAVAGLAWFVRRVLGA